MSVFFLALSYVASMLQAFSGATAVTAENVLQKKVLAPVACCNSATKRHEHMIVFVHGSLYPVPSLKAFFSSMKKLKGTWYQRYLDNLRSQGNCAYQPIGPLGLQKIDEQMDNDNISQQASFLSSYFLKKMYCNDPGHKDCHFSFYTFGWGGRLNRKHRAFWGNVFYGALDNEIATIKRTLPSGYDISLEIFTHSHGGNVALNMANAVPQAAQSWGVDRLVLLGTPIQYETVHLTQSLLFRKIYNVYSLSDTRQTWDVFSSKESKSRRRFDTYGNNIVQLEVVAGKDKPTHTDFWFFNKKAIQNKQGELSNDVPIFLFMPSAFSLLDTYAQQVKDAYMFVDRDAHGFSVHLKDKETSVPVTTTLLAQQSVLCDKQKFAYALAV